jgi:hypothetical protein
MNAESPNLQTNMNSQLNTLNQSQAQLQHQKLLQQQQQLILHQQQQQTQSQQIQLNQQQQLNNQVQIHNNSKILNGPPPNFNNASPLLKQHQQQQQQQQYQILHIPYTQNELFETLQQKQLQISDELLQLQSYLDINNLNINSITNLGNNQGHPSSVNHTYPKTNNSQILQANSPFLNQSLTLQVSQQNSHQSLNKPQHSQIQQTQNHMSITSQGGGGVGGGGIIYNPSFNNFNQPQMHVVTANSSPISFIQQANNLNHSQMQMANNNELLTDNKQSQSHIPLPHGAQFYTKNLTQSSVKQQTVQPLQYV